MNLLNELENISEWKAMRQYAELTSKIKEAIIFGGQSSIEMAFDNPISASMITNLSEYSVKTTQLEQSSRYRFEFQRRTSWEQLAYQQSYGCQH